MPTDTDKTLNGTPEPFRRPVVWGRPPATVFRAGPLPRGGSLPPLPQAPRMQPTPGILTGSMIPPAAPARAPAPAQAQAAAAVPAPDLTVRPLPTAGPVVPAPPSPARATASALPVAVASEPIPVLTARAGAVRKPTSRVPLYAGIALAAVTVLALGGWLVTRPPAEAPAAAAVAAPSPAAPTVEIALPESLPTPVPVTEPAAGTPAPVAATPAARQTATPAAPARTPPTPPGRPASPPPQVVAPPAAVATVPLIELAPAPAPGPAPTEAERPSTDPDAPIATRPQPLD